MLFLNRLASKVIMVIIAGMLFSMPAFCEDNSVEIYPLPALFASDSKSEGFNSLLENRREDMIYIFDTAMKRYFPNTVGEISDRTKYKTFVSYISIPRVSENKYKKRNLIDLFLPLTASVHFINAATGEMLYSYPYTSIATYETNEESLKNKNNDVIANLYFEAYTSLTDEIVKTASMQFKPFNIDTKVTDSYRGLYILDKGTGAGIAKGDLLTDASSNQLSIIFSDIDYAVGQKVLGQVKEGVVFNKYASGSLSQLKKPKVLLVNQGIEEGLYSLFSTAIGSAADFSLITVDKNFYAMQMALVSLNNNFKTENMQNRALPEYFLKLYVEKPLYTRYPSNKDYGFLDKYTVTACASMFDRNGRVVFNKCVDEEIADQVVSDIKFTSESRFEVLLKNAMVKLAESFSSEVKFRQGKLKITKADGSLIYIEDFNGLVDTGNQLTVFRKIKTEQKGKEVLVPIWEYSVIEREGKTAIAKASTPIVDNIEKVSKNDIVVAGVLGRGAQGAVFKYAPEKLALSGNELELPTFKDMAFLALASYLNAPLTINSQDFDGIVSELNSGYGFKQKLAPSNQKDELSIRVAYKITFIAESKTKNLLTKEYEITVGVASRKGEENLNRNGIAQKVKIQVPTENNTDIISYELMKLTYNLIGQAVANFK